MAQRPKPPCKTEVWTAPEPLSERDVLQDLLQPSLRIVLCGTAASTVSAAAGAYYANPQNKFWRTLHETGLTPTRLQPHEYTQLLRHGIGLTDLVKTHSGMDHELPLAELIGPSRARLRASIATYQPAFLAFTSKAAGRGYFGSGRRDYGEQAERIGDTKIWILPSTSGAANGSWRPELWQAFADHVGQECVGQCRSRNQTR